MNKIGTHCILELHDCPVALLNDANHVAHALTEASRRGLSRLLKLVTHRFDPQGITALGLLAESHISIHTWPEHGYAGADMFCCGPTAQPQLACQYLVDAFRAGHHHLVKITRGGAMPLVEAGSIRDTTGVQVHHVESAQWPDRSLAQTCG